MRPSAGSAFPVACSRRMEEKLHGIMPPRIRQRTFQRQISARLRATCFGSCGDSWEACDTLTHPAEGMVAFTVSSLFSFRGLDKIEVSTTIVSSE